MSNNVPITPGSGAVIATDDVGGGIQVQRVKLDLGGAGLSVPVVGSMPVSQSGTWSIGRTWTLTSSDVVTALTFGYDGAATRAMLTDTSGRPIVNINGTVPVSAAALPLPAGAAADATVAATNTALGAQADAAATTDAGTFSVLAFIKRGLANWTTLLARIPALVSGRIPVDGSGVTQPVSGTVGVSGTVPVSGTFWQTTQPVSGTFWQATQPVSGTVAIGGAHTGGGIYALGDTGLGVQAVRQDTRAALTSTDGQYDVPRMSALGALDVRVSQGVQIGSGSLTALGNLFSVDCQDYAEVAVQVTNAGTTCTIAFEQSNDNVNWLATYYYVVNSSGQAAGTTTSSAGIFVVPIKARYFRARVSVYGSGTVAATGFARALPSALGTVAATLNTGNNLFGYAGVAYQAGNANAASGSHIVAAATTNPTVVKGSPGRLIGWTLGNTSASWRYVKFHNQITSPTAGTGVVRVVAIPPGAVSNFVAEGGIGFSVGIALTIVTGSADSDATAVTAGDVVGEVLFA